MQETTNKVYLVIPTNPTPAITDEEELSEEALETVAGGVLGRCRLISLIRNANDLT